MRREENELLPLAERHLTASDWNDIAQAFGDNGDPLIGQKEGERFFAMFRKIVAQAPAPIGLGITPRP
jgi:hemerythrin-like domain-containing protein